MIEIVFSDSACGGLKVAQHFGAGDYIGGCTAIFLTMRDGSQPSQEEIAAAQKAAEEEQRLAWERATPMGGNPDDVFGFCLMLSIGDISADDFATNRQKAIDALWRIYPDAPSGVSLDVAAALRETVAAICKRVAQGEAIRMWYSNQPDELCGLCWFMAELQQFEMPPQEIYTVRLPEYICHSNGAVASPLSWGEVPPGEWHRYATLATAATADFCSACAAHWRKLQQENAPLRAVLNGGLVSVPETIYDYFILREIEAEEDEFQEAMVIGRVLGNYQLGIGDAWVAHRIKTMIDAGRLFVVCEAAKDMPTYHRILKKQPLQ